MTTTLSLHATLFFVGLSHSRRLVLHSNNHDHGNGSVRASYDITSLGAVNTMNRSLEIGE